MSLLYSYFYLFLFFSPHFIYRYLVFILKLNLVLISTSLPNFGGNDCTSYPVELRSQKLFENLHMCYKAFHCPQKEAASQAFKHFPGMCYQPWKNQDIPPETLRIEAHLGTLSQSKPGKMDLIA